MQMPQLRTTAVLLAALLTAACGSGNGSPVGPSPADSSGLGSGATVRGTVTAGRGTAQVRALNTGMAGITVSVEGTNLSVTTSSGGSFVLRGIPPGLVRLLFQGPGVTGTLELNGVTQTEEIELTIELTGSTIEVASQERVTGSEAQLEGKVVTADYAARTLVVGDTTVLVPEGIPITNGYRALDLEDVIVGARIHVKGSLGGDVLTASRIIVQQTGLERVTLSGVVSDVTGTCPDVAFKFGSIGVAVNGSTIFVQGTCADLVGGLAVEVKGLRRTDGSVLATMVKFKEAGTRIEFSGTISNLSGSCPARHFVADGREVRTNGSTAFLTPCATLANGQAVAIAGKVTGSGMVIASQIQ